jgi:alpha-mannosidase
MWRGIDGTSVLTHFPPENTYNSALAPEALRNAENNFKEKAVLDEMMVLFGVGDGGGGPKAEHIEQGIRQQNLEGTPKVKFGRADAFFDRISKASDELPVWSGELYLELHRGTLTTQSRTKRGNRKLEQALRETEYLLSCCDISTYPQDELDALWKTLLLNQFHDIIPGSSINLVYQVTEREHKDALATCKKLQDNAAKSLLAEDDQCLTLINTTNITQKQPIVLPKGWIAAEGIPCQTETDGSVVAFLELPPQDILCIKRSSEAQPTAEMSALILENECMRYEFSENGEITRAFDKEKQKEVLSGSGNVLTLYEDQPNNWDAWDIDIFYEDQALETATPVAHKFLGKGKVRQGIQFDTKLGISTISQKIYLPENSKRLEFQTKVDWHERHRMLRVAFPTTIRSDEATFDIQYGYAKRSTHRNTSWDMARFEVAAHKYADLSDNDYGVALLNDCKYGHKVLEGTIDLNLLRSPTHPDPDADQGEHLFTYSLLPHTGTLLDSEVIPESIQLNQPPLCFDGYSPENMQIPVKVSGHGVGLEVVKKAEKSNDIIIRIVEQYGKQTAARIVPTDASVRLVELDLMEWNEVQVMDKTTVDVVLQPFEIRTFAIQK